MYCLGTDCTYSDGVTGRWWGKRANHFDGPSPLSATVAVDPTEARKKCNEMGNACGGIMWNSSRGFYELLFGSAYFEEDRFSTYTIYTKSCQKFQEPSTQGFYNII